MDNTITIKLLDKSTIEEQLAVFRYAFHLPESDKIRNKWIAKHYTNPIGNSFIFGAILNNKVVGINCFQPCNYFNDGKTIKALQSCESGVLPECQGKGVWGKLMRFAINYLESETDYDLIIGFPNYQTSYPGFMKMKWETVANMTNYVLINNTQVFSSILFDNSLLQLIGRLFSVQKILPKLYANSLKNKVNIVNVKLKDALWVFNSRTHVEIGARWLEYKEKYKDLQALNAVCNGEVIGSCVFSLIEYHNKPVISINKFSIIDNCQYSAKSMFSLFCTTIASTYPETGFIRIWSKEKGGINSLLRELLFKKTGHLNPFIIKQLKQKPLDKNWDLSFFDLD